MRLRLLPLVVLASAAVLFGSSAPLTIKEVGLMLRSGYSSDTVLRELSKRHLANVLDAGAEKALKEAGASAALLDALNNTAFRASASQVAALEQKRSRMEAPLPETVVNPVKTASASASPQTSAPADQVYRVLRGNLVIRQ